MKLLLAIILVLVVLDAHAQFANNGNATVPVIARVDPTGLTGNGTGIRGVTSTNLTQSTTAIVQSFFSGGGVDLQPNGQAQVVTAAPVPGPVLVNSRAKGLIDYRNQLIGERMRLVQLIDNKRRDRQSSAIETAQVIAIERAIQQTQWQIARRGFKE